MIRVCFKGLGGAFREINLDFFFFFFPLDFNSSPLICSCLPVSRNYSFCPICVFLFPLPHWKKMEQIRTLSPNAAENRIFPDFDASPPLLLSSEAADDDSRSTPHDGCTQIPPQHRCSGSSNAVKLNQIGMFSWM